MPTASAEIARVAKSMTCEIVLKAFPSSPIRFDLGTDTFSKVTSEAFDPSTF